MMEKQEEEATKGVKRKREAADPKRKRKCEGLHKVKQHVPTPREVLSKEKTRFEDWFHVQLRTVQDPDGSIQKYLDMVRKMNLENFISDIKMYVRPFVGWGKTSWAVDCTMKMIGMAPAQIRSEHIEFMTQFYNDFCAKLILYKM